MSVGCIVIATPNTGAEELIKNGHNGFIIKHNFHEFKKLIELLLSDISLRKKISSNAINSMKEKNGFDNYIKELTKCVE